MTDLEEAELTDGQGRALSGHRAQTACAGYAKRMLARALPAARKRVRPHDRNGECCGNGRSDVARNGVQNDGGADDIAIA
jgi:hypothetical protein